MALLPVRRRERGELSRLHDEMDNLIGGFFGDWDWPVWGHRRWPALDIAENDNEFVVKAEVPGCRADDIDISVQNGTLVISGQKKEEEKKEGKGFYHVERSFGSFRREVNLATEVDPKKIDAVCENGVLTLRLPKSEKAKPMKIKVNGS